MKEVISNLYNSPLFPSFFNLDVTSADASFSPSFTALIPSLSLPLLSLPSYFSLYPVVPSLTSFLPLTLAMYTSFRISFLLSHPFHVYFHSEYCFFSPLLHPPPSLVPSFPCILPFRFPICCQSFPSFPLSFPPHRSRLL